MKTFLNSLLEVVFPRFCITCGSRLAFAEKFVCLHCHSDLHRTRFEEFEQNKAAQLFIGKFQFERATSIFRYEKGGKVQRLIHNFKYHDNKELASYLGVMGANELKRKQNSFFGSSPVIDYIIYVPLHPKKEKKRGYNQAEWIAKGISQTTGIPIIKNAVRRVVNTDTQTQKQIYERAGNVQDIFEFNPEMNLDGKHILLVDDVMTTGATIENCALCLHAANDVRLSLFSLAMA